jgi:hypothetical protein
MERAVERELAAAASSARPEMEGARRPGRRRRRPGKKEAATREEDGGGAGGAEAATTWVFRAASGANFLRQMQEGNHVLLEHTCFCRVSSISLLCGYRPFEDADPANCWR